MIPVPRSPLLLILLLPLAFLIGGIFEDWFFQAGIAMDMVIIILCGIDILISRFLYSLEVRHEQSHLLLP